MPLFFLYLHLQPPPLCSHSHSENQTAFRSFTSYSSSGLLTFTRKLSNIQVSPSINQTIDSSSHNSRYHSQRLVFPNSSDQITRCLSSLSSSLLSVLQSLLAPFVASWHHAASSWTQSESLMEESAKITLARIALVEHILVAFVSFVD